MLLAGSSHFSFAHVRSCSLMFAHVRQSSLGMAGRAVAWLSGARRWGRCSFPNLRSFARLCACPCARSHSRVRPCLDWRQSAVGADWLRWGLQLRWCELAVCRGVACPNTPPRPRDHPGNQACVGGSTMLLASRRFSSCWRPSNLVRKSARCSAVLTCSMLKSPSRYLTLT